MNQQLLEKFYNKQCTADEAREVILWLKDKNNQTEVEDLLASQWGKTYEGISADYHSIYEKILKEIASDKAKQKSRQLPLSRVYAAAAVVVLLVVSFFVLRSFITGDNGVSEVLVVKTTNAGEKLTTKLPDGTLVTLNSGSKLIFPENFTSAERKVQLEGEAYFSVAKNIHQPFVVKSGMVETRALGTAFNVRSEEGVIVVSLTEGKVVVNSLEQGSKGREEFFLMPGEEISYSSEGKYISSGTFDYKNTIAWKDGILVFDDVDIDELKAKIEKWYGVKLRYTNQPAKKWRFTSEYKNERLENVLEGLKYSKNINYVMKNDSVVITFDHPK